MGNEMLNPPAVVRAADDLSALAGIINAKGEQLTAADRDNLRLALEIGEQLDRARERCIKDGKGWLAWVKENVKCFGREKARKCLYLYQQRGKLVSYTNLGLTEALKMIRQKAKQQLAAAAESVEATPEAGEVTGVDGAADAAGTANSDDFLQAAAAPAEVQAYKVQASALIEHLLATKKMAAEISKTPFGKRFRNGAYGNLLRNLIALVEKVIPHAVCPTCNGIKDRPCLSCSGEGWVSEHDYKTLTRPCGGKP